MPSEIRRHALAKCEECTLNVPENKYVPSAGPKDADIAIVGEAPGMREAIEGKPFTGPSGKLLMTVLDYHKIDKRKVFLTNTVLCRPPENRTPTKKEIACCAPRLKGELTTVKPKILYAVGGTAASATYGSSVKITGFRAGPPKRSDLYPETVLVPTFHPANCLRSADNFPHLVGDFGKPFSTQVGFTPPEYVVIDDEATALKALAEINTRTDRIVIDIETAFDKDESFEHPNHSSLLCIGIGYASQRVAVLGRNVLASNQVCSMLGTLLTSKKVIAHNGKFDLKALLRVAPKAQLWFDTMLAHYVLDERGGGIHKLKYLAKEFLGAPDWDKEVKGYKNWADIPPDTLHRYNAYDVSCTWLLYERFQAELAEQGLTGVHEFLIRASNVLMHMEMAGLKIDRSRLGDVAAKMEDSLERKEKNLSQWVKNPRSWQQVQATLKKWNVETDSTDVEHLTAIYESPITPSEARLFVADLLDYRKEQKLYGTYIKGVRSRLYDGRVYPNFLLHGTTTGRQACRNPNLFNIPRDSGIKELFVPEDNRSFVQGDYSQLEYRVVTTLAQEPYLADIFRDPSRDVFWELARTMFGPDASKHHRQIEKRIVHGSNYGMGEGTMADQINSDAVKMGVELKVTKQVARRWQNQYFSTIPHVKAWQEDIKRRLFTEHDDLVTAFGRHRRFWLITKENKYDIEKEGLAFVPQSTGADICLTAMLRLFTEYGLDTRLSVYDSIMAEVDNDQVADVKETMRKVMMEAGAEFSDYVPFAVDLQASDQSWGALA